MLIYKWKYSKLTLIPLNILGLWFLFKFVSNLAKFMNTELLIFNIICYLFI